jgi:hypothetical protein
MKISFDFDETLSYASIQKYARKLILEEHEVWIITARLSDEECKDRWGASDVTINDDLYLIADSIGIPRDRIKFMNYADKSEFIKDKGFLWHLDDDVIEIAGINYETDCIGVSCYKNATWRDICDELMNK